MKIRVPIISIFIALSGISFAYAETPVTGEIFGEVIQSINMNDGSTYGISIEDIGDPAQDCDETAKMCNIKGFSWSDRVGWTVWDGDLIKNGPPVTTFPDEYYAKTAWNGNFGGYIWGEKYGWVSLSACNGLNETECNDFAKDYCQWTGSYCVVDETVRVPDDTAQDQNEWGVYIDFCPAKGTQAECESATSDTYCNWDSGESVCVFDAPNNPNGQRIRGFAWSEYLGWIKFGPEAGEETDFAGAFTNWFPDLTPPEITIPPAIQAGKKVWIPNDNPSGRTMWRQFADEDDSYVDLTSSEIYVETIDNGLGGEFENCEEPIGPYTNGGDLLIEPGDSGDITLRIENTSNISNINKGILPPPHGFCRLELGGVLYNGSKVGYYFGDEGEAKAIADGVNPADPAPNVIEPGNLVIFVRAGTLDPTTTSITGTGNDVVADGTNMVSILFGPTDIAGNSILTVDADIDGNFTPADPADRVRNFELFFDFDNNTYTYSFDSIDWVRDFVLGNPKPLILESDTYAADTHLWYPKAESATPNTPKFSSLSNSNGTYQIDLTGYAPTTTEGNHLELTAVQYKTSDLALPQISPTQGPWLADATEKTLSAPQSPDLPFIYNFRPAIDVTSGSLNPSFLAIDQPAEATFTFETDPDIAANISEYSLDNLLSFHDTGIGSDLMDVQDINLTTLSDMVGRTNTYDETGTRYALISDTSTATADTNQFHSNSANYHSPAYDFENPVDLNGEYFINGDAYVNQDADCLKNVPTDCPPIDIDRTDILEPVAYGILNSSDSKTFSFDFTPTRFLGSSASQITFDIDQYLEYYFPSYTTYFAQHVVYPATPQLQDVPVKAIGFETSGVVGGEKVFDSGGDRDLETITTTSSANLRKEIRRNVALLTRSLTPCEPASLNGLTTAASSCVVVDDTNKTIVAYYSGSPDDTILLDQIGGDTITVPDYKYTLILESVNLEIVDNIIYSPVAPNSSFGIILIQDSDKNGGDVYLRPEPTNIVGLLYAEGTLFSRNSSGIFYYGTNPGVNDASSSELMNQLFWQGSIASVNTIGGTTTLATPPGIRCEETDWVNTDTGCSQAYDLDFIRRFATVDESGLEIAPVGYKFSGGGECQIASPPATCTAPTMPTTVTLDPTSDTIDASASKSLDAFFIERDNRPVPPGFSSKGGFTSTQEIR